MLFVEYWIEGVLECCQKTDGFPTITPALQYSNTPKIIQNDNYMVETPSFELYIRNF